MIDTPEKDSAPAGAGVRPWLLADWDYPLLLVVLIIVLAGLAILAAGAGPYKLTYGHIFSLVKRGVLGESLNPAEATALAVILQIRLPRIVLAALVGMGLSLAGTAFQGILLNPLAEPFTLGVAAGAAFGASLALSLGFSGALLWSLGLVPLMALAGAAAALVLVLALGSMAGGFQHGTLILAGVVVSAFLSSLISLVKFLYADSLSSIVFWIMGSLSARNWGHVLFALPYVGVGGLILFLFARELNILTLGDAPARQLGLAVNRVRLILLVAASLITAGVVAVSGIIGFVGLIVPHLARLMVGPDHRRVLVTSALAGAILLIAADTLARIILPYGQELPVGIITALLGGPFFCYLLKVARGHTLL
jgi:iron complex transport system permease protein|uniref:Iron ABC transporter permease n=1 Tax=Desulfobacca acetoxidans TaxID=60893 RepID=A0A7V6A3A6_9BACT